MKRISLLLITFTFSTLHSLDLQAEQLQADVVVYGGTSAGVVAAVQTKRLGKTVILIEPRPVVGGLTVSGLGMTDTGNKAVIGGTSREFYQRIKQKYDDPARWKFEDRAKYDRYREADDAMWTFEPHVASEVYADMLHEAGITPILNANLISVATTRSKPARIISLTLSNGNTVSGRQFIDVSYEGDLMALSSAVQFTVGRESNATYGERLNGVQVAQATKHQFIKNVDPYRIAGDRSSGLLPGIGDGPGIDGEADHRLQAYNYRLCITDVKENQILFEKPAGYDPLEFELLLRNFEAGDSRLPLAPAMMPNRKTDVNNNHAVSTDYIGMNYDYANGSPEVRKLRDEQLKRYTQGLMWTLANHPRVPEGIRAHVSQWGWAKDEWTDNGNWQHWSYIREARRMVSDYVQTELDCQRIRVCEDSVGLGSYNMDSHNVQRHLNSEGFVRNEGDVQVSPGGPYLISYKSVVPKKSDCSNLFVPVCLSSSHIAYGSIRMEPVFMILGQSSATAACLSIDHKCAVQDLPYAMLREQLLKDKQVLDLPPGTGAKVSIDPKSLAGIVIDDTDAIKVGDWTSSSSTAGYVGAGYLHDSAELQGEKSVRYPVKVPQPGKYEVLVSYGAFSNRSTKVQYIILTGGKSQVVFVSQQQKPSSGKSFHSLGVFEFSGTADESVTISNTGSDGHVIADAVQLIPPAK